jgi:hypothetical protein
MKTSNWMKRFAAIGGSALMGLTLTIGANATNPEQVAVEVTWIAPIVVAEVGSLRFGLLDVGMAENDTVTINTDGTYSESVANTVVGGTQAQAQLTITVANSTAISILVDTIGSGTYYTIGSFECSYELAPDVTCDSAYPVTSSADSTNGDTLDIGAVLLKNSTVPALAGADDTTFDVTVIFQ